MPRDIKLELAELTKQIPPGSQWKYVDGGSYRVLSLELNATNYEETHNVGIVVVYEQLYNGSFAKGQIWVRLVEDFQSNILKDGAPIKKFTRID